MVACSGARVAIDRGAIAAEPRAAATDVAWLDAARSPDAALEDGDAQRSILAVSEVATDAAVRATSAACVAGDGEVTVSLERALIDSECEDGIHQCYVVLGIRVTNCTSRPIALRRARETRPDGGGIEWSFDLVSIAPGTSDVRRVRFFDEREDARTADVSVVDERGVEWRWRGAYRVRNPARRRALAACEACQGLWGRWGISQFEGCNCRTRDAGRACEDGRDCEGLCVPTGSRVVTPAVEARCECPAGCRCSGRPRRGANQTVEALCVPICTAARPAMIVSVGVCSEHRMNFGCRSYIANGARDEGPHPAGGRLSYRCAD